MHTLGEVLTTKSENIGVQPLQSGLFIAAEKMADQAKGMMLRFYDLSVSRIQ